MIQLTTLSVPGTLAMPQPPGSPLATTSDFALALATISGPAGAAVIAPLPLDGNGIAVVDLGDRRQAIAGGGTILPDGDIVVAQSLASGATAATANTIATPAPSRRPPSCAANGVPRV